MRAVVLAAFGVIALAPCFAGAQQCGSVTVGRAPTYCAPVHAPVSAYVAPYVQPVTVAYPGYNTLLVATPVVIALPYPTYTVATIAPVYAPGSYASPGSGAALATSGVNVGAAAATAAPAQQASGGADVRTTEVLGQLLSEIKAMRRDLSSSRGLPPPELEKAPKMPPAGPPEEPVGTLPTIASVLGKCVECHDNAVSKKKGGDFAMFNAGTTVALTNIQAKLVLERTKSGEMPLKGKSLTAPEYKTLEKWIGTIN